VSEIYGSNIEIIITHISYNSEKMDVLTKKYFNGNQIIRDILVKRQRLWILNTAVKTGKMFDVFKNFFTKKRIIIGEIEVYNYLEGLEVKKMDLGLELKVELKNIDISKIINEQALPKTQDNVFVYELLKLLNEELDENVKKNCIKLIFDILNEKRIIPKYIRKISKEIEDLSGLELEFDEARVKVKN
jgi:hypothetical protein